MLRELTGKEARRKRRFSCHFVLLRYSQVWGLTQATLSLWVLSREVYLAECLQSFYKRLSVCNFCEQGWHFGTVWHSRMFFEDYGKFFRTKFRVARFSFFPPNFRKTFGKFFKNDISWYRRKGDTLWSKLRALFPQNYQVIEKKTIV